MITRGNAPAIGGGFFSARIATRLSFAVLLLLLSFGARDALAITFTSNSSGNWSNASIWTPNGVPITGDNVTVNSGHTVVIDTVANPGNLTVDGSVDTSSFGISVSGSLTMNGGTIVGSGPVLITGSTSTVSGTGSITPSLQFGAAANGTIASGAVYTVTGQVQVDGSLTNNGSLTVQDTTNGVTGTGSFVQGTTGALSVRGPIGVTLFDATATGNKVDYSGTSAQTVRATTYYDLALTGTGPYTAAGSLVAAHAFSSGSNSPAVNLGLFTLQVGTSGTGDFAGTGTFNGTGSISLSGSGNVSGILTINNPLSISGTRTIQAGAGLTLNGAVSLATSTMVTNAASVTMASMTGVDATSTWKNTGSLAITGALFPLAGTLDAATSGNTVNYSGSVLQTVYVTTYDSLAFTGTGAKTMVGVTAINADFTISGGSAVTVTQALTIGRNFSTSTSGAVMLGAFTHSIGGGISVTGTSPTFTGSTIAFNGSVNPQILTCIGCSFDSITFSGSSSKTFGSSFNVLGNVTINSGATVTGGALGYAIGVAGNWSNSGTFTPGNSTVTLSGTTRTVSASSFYNLTISGSITALGNLTVLNDLSVGSGGTLGGGTFTHTITHNFGQTGTYFPGTSTVAFTGSTSSTFNGAFYDLSITKGAFTATAGGGTTVSHNLSVNSGTLMVSSATLSVTGSVTNNGAIDCGTGAISVAGDLVNNGPFGSTSGTLTLNGTGIQSISGSTSTNPTNLTVTNLPGINLQKTMSVGGTLLLAGGNVVVTAGEELFVTGAISRTSGYVIGKLELAFSGPSSKTFPVGTVAGYTPVDVTVTGGSGSLAVIDTDGFHPSLTGFNGLNRYWAIGNTGITQADFTFHFLAADIFGTESAYEVGRYSGGSWGRFAATSRDTTGHSITLTGVTGIAADWTAAEAASLGLVAITSVHPSTAHVFGLSTLYIEGTSLAGSTVDLDGSPAVVLSNTATRIVVRTPSHAAGLATVNVTAPSAPVSCPNCVTYTNAWKISRDFSPTVNPSVNWTLGSEPSLNGAFSPFAGGGTLGFAEAWSDITNADVVHNPEPSAITVSGWTLPVDGLGMHPGSGGAYSTVRWTAPSTGVYHVAGSFADMQASTADVHIYNGATVLFTGAITGASTAPFSFDRLFTSGQNVDFLTGDGGNGSASDGVLLDATITPTSGADLALTTTVPATVTAGAPYSYTLAVTNAGPDTATTVAMNHTIAGATVASIAGTGSWICTNTVTTVTCTASSLVSAAGGSVTVNTIAPASGSVTYTTAVTADNDPNAANNTANDTTAVNANVDLSLSATVSPSSGAVGTDFDYTLPVANAGPSAASNVTITSTLPPELSFVSATGATCIGTTTISCTVGSIAASGSTSVVIRLHGGSAGTPATTFAVSATETDSAPGNNTAAQTVTISGSSLVVTSPNDSGAGTLRAAIAAANNAAVCPAPCTITFNLAVGQTALTLSSPLPPITASQVTVDATTQPGYAVGAPLVTMSGTACTCLKGFELSGNQNTIRGFVIGGFVNGIYITGSFNKVEANLIGLTAANTPVANVIGVLVLGSNNTIGGSTAAQRNVISRSSGTGIHINSGSNNTVQGNYIGTSTGAATAQPNGTGIKIEDGLNNLVGGPAAAAGNVIAGNSGAGIELQQSVGVTDGNTIQSNFIGNTGTTAIPNAVGVRMISGIRGWILGNTIATNSSKGVEILSPSTQNLVTGNVMHDNGTIGIDLNGDGPSADDPGDSDIGGNDLQNRPVILDATLGGASTLFTHLNLDSNAVAATQSLRIELFAADTNGLEGLQSLGFQCFAGNQLSNAAMNITGAPIVAGSKIVATATSYTDTFCFNANDGTSEFSPNAVVAACATPSSTITASGPTTFCSGGSVTLSVPAVAGNTYLWSNLATTSSITVTAPGSYSVTVTNGLGCSSSSSPTNVTVNAIPTATITASGPTTFCAGGSVTLSAPAILGNTFLWSNGATTPSITVTATGSYFVTVTRNSCSATSASVNVTANTAPSATITASGPTTFCAGGSVTLDAPAGAGFTYLWSNSATTQSITVTASGSYSVTVTDASGCSAVSSPTAVNVTPAPSATITAPATVAASSTGNIASVAAGPAGTLYSWSISGGAIATGQGTPSIAFSAGNTTALTLGVNVITSGCSSNSAITIPVTGFTPPPPPPPPTTHADLGIAVSGPGSAPASGNLVYTITVTNAGPDPAHNITLGHFIDYGVMTSLTGSGWSCFTSPAGGTCTMATLQPGTYTLTSLVTAPNAAATIHNSASIASATNDPNGANNEAFANTTVLGAPTTANCANEPPSLIAPADGATNVSSPATFSWSAVAGATQYEVWIANAGSSPSLAGTTSSTSITLTLPGGDIAWYVIADFAQQSGCPPLVSAQRRLNVTGGANCGGHTTASLLAPSPGANLQSPVTFQWMPVPQAIGYRVWFRVDNGAAQDAGTTDGATQLSAPVPAGAIEWYVDALFTGCPSTRSQSSRFGVAKTDPCAEHIAATPTAPDDHSTSAGSQLEFRWTAAPDAVAYRVWAIVNGGTPAVLGTTEATSLKAGIFAGSVEWYVETLFDGCPSIDSLHRSLTVPRSQECGTAVSQLVSPAPNGTTPNPMVNFVWTNVPEANGYELWLGLNGGARILAGTTPGNVTSLLHEAAPGQLEWFVRATFDGCTARDSAHAFFRVEPPANCSDQRPLLTAPLENAAGVLSPVTFRWTVVPGASPYRVYAGVNGATPSLVGTTSAPILQNVALPAGRVDWYVEATRGGNCADVRSSTHRFSVATAATGCNTPDAPSLIAPGEVSSNVRYAIQWERVPGASSYVVQESATADFSAPSSTPTTSDRVDFQHANSSAALTTFFYRVRAVASCNASQSAYSPVVGVGILPASSGGAKSVAGALPVDASQLVTYTIPLDASLAGQSFVATPNQPWLTVMPNHGTVPNGGTTLTVVADTNGLPIGTSLGGITLTFGSNNAVAGRPVTHAAAPSTTTVSMSKVAPISVIPKNTPPPDALIIPAVAHADGVNSKFESDVRITNTAPQVMKYQLTFTPSGDEGIKSGKQTQIEIDPGRTIAIDDVLKSWFSTGESSATGVLEIRPLTQTATTTSSAARSGVPNIVTFASSRTFNTTATGTFGQYIPAIPFANFIGKAAGGTNALASVLSLQQIAQSDAYRTNLGLVEGSGEPASLVVSVFGNAGQKLTEFPVELKGGQHVQLNSFLAERGVQVDDGRVEVKVTSPGGKVTAYASVLDNRTNDPLLVTPVAMSATGASKYVVAGVADLSNGLANWRTDMRVYNNSTEGVDATLSFVSQSGGEMKSVPLSLKAGEVKQLDSVLASLFGVANEGGALHLTTSNPSSLIATARTYNQTSNGTYGQFISAVTPDGAIGNGSRPLQLLQVEESDRYRSNIGIAEVSGQPATVEVTVLPPDSKVAGTLRFDLAPNQFIQYNALLRSLSMENTYNARVSVKVTGGTGRVTAYASVIDSATQDPTYVPAQ
jgi:uncharacterized repeat protein (TIGR01451 family)